MSIRRDLISKFGQDVAKNSMINHEERITPILKILKPRTILEIGTLKGVSAAYWASNCECVITLDIQLRKSAFDLWQQFGVASRIAAVQISNEEAKHAFVGQLEFDLAFVDGEHTSSGVASDFACTKKAKAVLFHDYKPEGGPYTSCGNRRLPGVAAVIDAIQPAPLLFGPLCSQMALWLNPDRISAEEKSAVVELFAGNATVLG